jgi:NAD(P)-dependent dehydrogenase (short-subunit alcohol dehydrogenase family)
MGGQASGKEQRRALVIGGSGGIGAAVCRALAVENVDLVVHGGRDAAKLSQFGDILRVQGCSVTEICQRISTADDGLHVLSLAGAIDILIVSFGPYSEGSVVELSPEIIRDMAELNYVLPAAVISSALPAMRDAGFGRIAVFGSTFGDRITGFRKTAAYAASKAALASYVRSVARQVADTDIRCNMVCPGYVQTEFLGTDEIAAYNKRMPSGRAQTPESIASLVAWLVSDANTAVNGAIIAADEGLS